MLSFNWISLIVFVVLMLIIVLKNRKNMELQRMLFPILYSGLWKTGFGINFMKKVAYKYKELIKFLGLIGVGVGFVGMIAIVYSIIQSVFMAFEGGDSGVALVLPQTNIPGIGFLPFWYWIISLAVLILIHEFAHGIVSKAYGIPIKSSGLGFFGVIVPLIPLAFVEPDEKKLKKADTHIQYSIYAAGPFSNILTALLVMVLFLLVFNPIGNAISTTDGITFDKMEGYPSETLPDDFIIREANGVNIETNQDFISLMNTLNPGDELTLSDGTYEHSVTLTDNEGNAFLGITTITNNVVPTVNSVVYSIYDWIRGLFKWIGLLSFFIGLANLLPIGPVDGGQMLRTFLLSIMKNEEKALKLWMFVSLFVVGIIVLTFVV